MKQITFALPVLLTLLGTLRAHDTWVETNTNVIRQGDAVYVAFKLGNHGNDHRDFKLAGKPKPDTSTLNIISPAGTQFDLRPGLIDEGYTPGEGYFSTRFVVKEPGLYMVSHTSDAVVTYAPKRSIKSAKVFFVCSPSLDRVTEENPGFDRVLGHDLELIPRTNPVTPMGPGQPLEVEVQYRGKPLSGARVAFIPKGVELAAGFDSRHEQRTDAQGRVRFEPRGGNQYLVVAHHEDPERRGDGYTSTKFSATLFLFVPEICPCCGE
jgi:uncharacterized GH25 family protein